MVDAIRVLVYAPDKRVGELRAIPNELSAMQKIVGGYIEVAALRRGLSIVVNEDGHMLQLPPNRDGIVGTFFVVRTNPGSEEFASLTESDVMVVRAMLEGEGE